MSDKSDIISKFRCNLCNKQYASNSSLWNHNNKFHKTSGSTIGVDSSTTRGSLGVDSSITINNKIYVCFLL